MDPKPKLFNINNFLASETGRLTSLSLKRDLSLGGNKHKKVYKPNLNVIRNKNKGKVTISNKIQQHNKRNSKPFQNNRHNNHGRFIQSTSVFSEGAGELRRPTIHSDRYMGRSERDQAMMTMPKIIKTNWEVNTHDEKTVIDELLAEDEDSASDNEGDYSPVILPLKNNKVGFLKAHTIKKEELECNGIKEETPTAPNSMHKICDNILNYDVPLSFRGNKFYDDDHPCISLLRMPDSLPGKGFTEDSDKITDFDLNQMVEGKVGKLLIRKSGKIEIQVGKTKYFLDSIESNPFKEDLMHIPVDTKSGSFGPDMANLGNIDEKYVLSPSWKKLFEQKKLKK